MTNRMTRAQWMNVALCPCQRAQDLTTLACNIPTRENVELYLRERESQRLATDLAYAAHIQLIETLKYQATAAMSDCWERRHIDAMVNLCEYVAVTYPLMYQQIKHIHEHFINKQEDM
jgi:hypothetical protein